ncbi:MAG: hypothetical protein FWD12_01950 [Alphaproteobacteria bacterium]|nr:hypothetical protein [Alphaproteobacteria bacterium]
MGKVFLVVRAVVTDAARRADFDRWYQAEHLPEAMKAFDVRRGIRCWSRTDPAVHYAVYEFPSVAEARRAEESPAIGELIAAFDRAFPAVTRSREIIEIVQESDTASA